MSETAPTGAVPGAVGPSRLALVVNGLLALMLLWLFGGDLWLFLQVRTAEVAAVPEPPRVVVPLLGVLAVVAGAVALARGYQQKAGPGWRGYRLFPIAAVVLLFLDLAVFASVRPPLTPHERLVSGPLTLAEFATQHSDAAGVPTDKALLERAFERLGPVPLSVKGEAVAKWQVEVRTGCQGPSGEVKGATPGTLVYCVAPGRRLAWVTVVGLPWGERFGSPAIQSVQQGLFGVVDPTRSPLLDQPPADPQLEGGLFDPSNLPLPVEAGPDGGETAP